jgi:thymidine kinase
MAKLHFYYSAMNAGKTTLLLQSSHNYRERGMDTLVILPEVGTRYVAGKIISRIGLSADAVVVEQADSIFAVAAQAVAANKNIRCILVDEAHFLTKAQVQQLCAICDKLGLPVLAYGIRTDFKGEPFPGSLYLLAWADILIEVKTICHCGRKATMNQRVDDQGHVLKEGNQVEIGGNERYVALCRKHFHF